MLKKLTLLPLLLSKNQVTKRACFAWASKNKSNVSLSISSSQRCYAKVLHRDFYTYNTQCNILKANVFTPSPKS